MSAPLPHIPASQQPTHPLRALLSNLIYAGDIVLLAHCPAHLQQLLDALLTLCTATGLQTSMPKTNVMIFRRLGRQTSTQQHVFTLGSLPLKHTDTYKYLVVNITSSGNPSDYMPPARGNVALAYCRMRQQYCSIACGENLQLQLSFFSAIVTSTAMRQRAMGHTSTDSCRAYRTVTATREVPTQAVQGCTQLAQLPLCSLEELGEVPLPQRWLQSAVRFYSQVVSLPFGDLFRDCMYDSMRESAQSTPHNQGFNERQCNNYCVRLV